MNKFCALAITGLLASAITGHLFPSIVRANPSTKEPTALLKIRAGEKLPGDHLAPDYAAIQARYTKAKATSDELWKKAEDKTLALGDARQLGPLYLLIAALQRDAEYLKTRGEPSGYDLALRAAELDERLTRCIGELGSLPTLNRTALMNEINKSHAAGLKRVPQIEGLVKRNQFLQAEGEKVEIFDDMMRNGIWFRGPGLVEYFRPFQTPLPEATELRMAKAKEELQAIAAQGPDFAKLQSDLAQAATAIGGSGQATWNGQTLTGPDLLLAWNAQWTKVQAGAQRSAMADWTSEQIGGIASVKYEARLAAQKQFAQGVPAALAAIVQADAQRVTGPDAAALHKQYVAAIGTLCALGPRQDLESALAPSLKALAAKAGLEQEVAAYEAATGPVLAWKRFFARAKAKALAGNQPRLQDWCTTVLKPPHQPAGIALESEISDSRQVRILSTPNKVLPGVFAAGPNPVIVASDIVPVAAAGGRGVARYQQRVFALVGPPPADSWKTAGDLLEQSLLASPANPPLSLAAATALAGARLGVFESVGGPVDTLTLEPLLTRFTTLPDEAGSLLPRGVLSAEMYDGAIDQLPLAALTVRCDLTQPLWHQHECFVLQP